MIPPATSEPTPAMRLARSLVPLRPARRTPILRHAPAPNSRSRSRWRSSRACSPARSRSAQVRRWRTPPPGPRWRSSRGIRNRRSSRWRRPSVARAGTAAYTPGRTTTWASSARRFRQTSDRRCMAWHWSPLEAHSISKTSTDTQVTRGASWVGPPSAIGLWTEGDNARK